MFRRRSDVLSSPRELELAHARLAAVTASRAPHPTPIPAEPADPPPTDVDDPDPPEGPPPDAVAPPSWHRLLPEQLRGARWLPSRAGAAALIVAVVVAVVSAAVLLLRNKPHPEIVAPPPVVAAVPTAQASPSPRRLLVVSVVGKVRHPGLHTMPDGSRVDDAIRVAGGVAPGTDLTTLNLARKVADGEQIVVGTPPAPAPGPAASAPPGSADGFGAPINLNTATAPQLDALPGVGPVLAQRILDWRTAHGRFDSVEQLRQIDGIGPRTFERLQDKVTL